jgi:hypothetical protein
MKRAMLPAVLLTAVVLLVPALVWAGCGNSGVVGGAGDTETAATFVAGVLGSTSTTVSSSPTSFTSSTSTTLGAPPTSVQATVTTKATTTTTAKVTTTTTDKATTTTKTTLGAPPSQPTTTFLQFTIPTLDLGTTVTMYPWNLYEETDPRIQFQGHWEPVGPCSASGGYFANCGHYGSGQVRFRFSGRNFQYLAQTSDNNGYAKITIDDSPVSEIIDLYSAVVGLQKAVYTSPTLDYGVHVVVIEWTGEQNVAAVNDYASITFDAVWVKGVLVDP